MTWEPPQGSSGAGVVGIVHVLSRTAIMIHSPGEYLPGLALYPGNSSEKLEASSPHAERPSMA